MPAIHPPFLPNRALPADFPGGESLLVGPGRVTAPDGSEACLETGPQGGFGLCHVGGGRRLRLTSALDPAAEDRALVERFSLNPGQGVLCLGLGLGYHVEELARRLKPETPLWVLESRPELAACALLGRDLGHLFRRPGFRLFIGPFDGPPWSGRETPPPQILWRPATVRHFAAEYPGVADPAAATVRVRRRRRLLLFQSGYFLDRELRNAARALNLETAVWRFERGPRGSGENFKELLNLIRSFRPDLALTVNHLGFDAEGLMDDLLTRLKLPAASWFVDSPAFILEQTNPSPWLTAFSWDRDYLPLLRKQGFSRVHHLPLATDETFFHPVSPPLPMAQTVSFVGDSLTAATRKVLGKLGLGEDDPRAGVLTAGADRLARNFLADDGLLPSEDGLRALVRTAGLPLGPGGLTDLAALVTWRGSRLKRLDVLKALPWSRLTVAGDPHWGALLGLDAGRLVSGLDYYRELSPFYQTSRVNLNITSAQMKTGLNQRIFDVPAAGAFLLTDDQKQLAELFEPGREVITYGDPAEARHLAVWYADHPAAREKVARAGQRRAHRCHLYRHRMAALLAAMEAAS